MKLYDDETLGAYVDGELDVAACDTIERALAQDPDLARRVEEQRRLRRALGTAFDSTLTEPLPERLLHAARGPVRDTVVDVPATRERPATWRAPQYWALAASVVVGALLGRAVLTPDTGATLLAVGPDGAVATGALATALSRQLAADRDGLVQISLSYRAKTGEYCRTFEIRGSNAAQAGLACRGPEAWRVQVLEAFAPDAAAGAVMRPASSAGLPEGVRRAVEASIAGDVLDETDEAAARDEDWR